MQSQKMKALVERYFTAVDAQDLPTIMAVLSDDCVFSVETHGVVLPGKDQIAGMFHRLWANHAAVRHHDFRFVCEDGAARVSVQFQVENTEHDGSVTRKSNCNFFDVRGEVFNRVAVYMAGANTLEG